MTIYYRDHLGTVAVAVENGIDFIQSEGIAIFEDGNGNEYKIPISSINYIGNV